MVKFQHWLFAVIIVALAISCDDSVDIYKSLNALPVLELRKVSESTGYFSSISDSFRLSTEGYRFYYHLQDELPVSTFKVDYSVLPGAGEFSFDNDSTMTFFPEAQGLNVISIIMEDIYGESASANASVFVFENLLPVALLSISKENTTYILDASDSYDLDRNFGGLITSYEFRINGNTPIEYNSPVLELTDVTFENPVSVELRVKDNSNAWSQKTQEILYP
jgi:hypothetical protein